ncbi:visual pigment-like receptor peropsin isoform X1 [Amblyomma americanum]
MNNTTEALLATDGRRDVVVGSYLLAVGLVGSVGNGIVLAMYACVSSVLDPTSLLLISLAASDFGILVGCPFSAAASFSGRWLFGDGGCQAYAFMGFFFGSAHIGTLTLLALDRYLATCRIGFRGKPTYRRYVQLLGIVWFYGFFWAVMPLLGWARYGLEPSFQSCTIDWRHNDASYKSFTVVYFVLGFFVPASIMVVCYRTSAAHIRVPKPTVVHRTDMNDDFWANQDSVTTMVVLIVATFFAAWTPYAVLCLWAVFGNVASVPHLVAVLPPLFCKTASAINPFIYFFSNPRIRADIYALLTCRCRSMGRSSCSIEEDYC